ncbi:MULTISPECIES: DUF4870 domain-containing protein [Arthrobacter]|uniref:DUF4870 domain-containing protein n=1 Tax=Arthrobacter psychrochitiniphilus TaxID=291045 RepID=A0A2V3DXF9_9MICC|nr:MULTISPECIES: DUF4870 domain-containing protein [Arthrobacter]NYG17666.1 hypothetical protein [Arthrobacter psychrochitiniphilus]PXA65268.1 DUF4870 domain-containing protein [Arthrobacter psychrochitiniphilus]
MPVVAHAERPEIVNHPVNQSNVAPQQPLTPSEDKQWAFMSHCGGILGCVPSLLIYKFLAARGRFTAQESKEALNFTLIPTALAVLLNIVAIIAHAISPGSGTIFSLLALLIWAFLTVFSIIGAVRVNSGQPYRYPLNPRLIK